MPDSMDIVERVARAIAQASGDITLAFHEPKPSDTPSIAMLKKADTEKALRMARAALEAIREPTEAMVEAGDAAQTETDGPYAGEQVAMASFVPWRAMINAALGEE